MGKEPDEIRQEIEETRARMGNTVEAIGYKTDVPARARDSVQEKKDNLVQSVTGVKDRLVGSIVGTKESVGGSMSNAGSSISDSISGAGQSISGAGQSVADGGRAVASRVGEATPNAQDLRHGVQRTAGMAQENPLGLAIGSIAVGFIAGLMVPATRVERQKIGPIADQVVDKARETGQEAMDRGKQVAQEAAQTARQVVEETKNTAQEAAQRGVEDLKSTAQEQGQELASSAQENASDLTGGADVSGEQSAFGTTQFPPIADTGLPSEGPEISGNDLISGHTGIAGTGTITDPDAEQHNHPGGTPTI